MGVMTNGFRESRDHSEVGSSSGTGRDFVKRDRKVEVKVASRENVNRSSFAWLPYSAAVAVTEQTAAHIIQTGKSILAKSQALSKES